MSLSLDLTLTLTSFKCCAQYAAHFVCSNLYIVVVQQQCIPELFDPRCHFLTNGAARAVAMLLPRSSLLRVCGHPACLSWQVGTLLYIAPEIVRGDRYDERCDVYSFALVLLAMLELRDDIITVFAEEVRFVPARLCLEHSCFALVWLLITTFEGENLHTGYARKRGAADQWNHFVAPAHLRLPITPERLLLPGGRLCAQTGAVMRHLSWCSTSGCVACRCDLYETRGPGVLNHASIDATR